MSNETELAWAAGFFDGEGSTTVTKCNPKAKARDRDRPQVGLRVSLAQVELEPLERFHAAVGVGRVRGPYQYSTDRQPHFQWGASNMDVLRVIDALWPYLSNVKRLQAWMRITQYEMYLQLYPVKRNQYD